MVNGIEWEYEMYHVFGSNYTSNNVSITGDTIINGQDCKILEREFTNCNLRPKQDFIYQEDNQIFYYHFEDSLFHILYDFNVEIGDTIKIRNWGTYANTNDYFFLRVDSIGIINIGLNQRKKFKMAYGAENDIGEIEFINYYFEIIEGIGCTINFFYWYDTGWCDGFHVNQLRCYYHPQLGNFGNLSECNLTTNTKETLNINSPSIFPNPFSNEINISFSESIPITNLKLYDGQGNLVLTKKIKFNNLNIFTLNSLSGLQNGIYFLLIEDLENQKTLSRKLLKINKKR